MTHPLTDEIINEIMKMDNLYEEDLRFVADWQLERVIEWIKECADYGLEYHDHAECDRMIKHLKKAMRPQQQEDN